MMKWFTYCLLFISFFAKAQDAKDYYNWAEEAFDNKQYVEASYYYSQIIKNWGKSTKQDKFIPYNINRAFENELVINDSLQTLNKIKEKYGYSLLYSFQYSRLDSLLAQQRPIEDQTDSIKYLWCESFISKEAYLDGLELYMELGVNNKTIYLALLEGAKEKDRFFSKNKIIEELHADTGLSVYNYQKLAPGVILANVLVSGEEENRNTVMLFKKKGAYLNYSSLVKGLPNSDDVAGFSLDTANKIIYFSKKEKDYYQLYFANFHEGKYLEAKKLGEEINYEGYNSIQPHYVPSKKMLYYVSDKPNGEGGYDVWSCQIDQYGKITNSANLGSRINTEKDEFTPFYDSKSKAIYFSSNGWQGYGGQDVFMSVSDQDKWMDPVNLGMPLNSGKEDLYFYKEKEDFYVSSNRLACETCVGKCMNVFHVVDIQIVLNGTVKDEETDSILPGAKIELVDLKTGEVMETMTNKRGEFRYFLGVNKQFKITASLEDYFANVDSVQTRKSSEIFYRDITLKPIPKGEITLEGILYDLNKASLRKESMEILDSLVKILEENPEIRIELSSHTDSRGSARYNQKLSQRRAESCVKYLTSRGIEKSRLVAIGYGESKLLVENARTEEEHQKNRRTSFSIIE